MSSKQSSPPWYRAVLGDKLARRTSPEEDKQTPGEVVAATSRPYTLVPTEEVLRDDVEVLGLYFPPLLSDDLTERLLDLHQRLNPKNKESADKGKSRRLLIVQVLTPLPSATTPTSPTSPTQQRATPLLEVPWFAIPPDDYDRQRRVCGRYRVQADVAVSRLVLLDGRTGRLVTRCGRERLLADPQGRDFPWPSQPLSQVLAAARLLQRHGDGLGDGLGPGRGLLERLLRRDKQDNKQGLVVIGLYFSAHWCPPCRAFTPQLISTYNAVRERGFSFEVIFVSSDRSEESFAQYARSMPWPAVSWEDQTTRQELAAQLSVQGIPTLVLLDKDCALITDDARARVNDDPQGKDFPWRPEPVSLFTERCLARLHEHPALILFVEGGSGEMDWAMSLLKQAAEAYAQRHPPSPSGLREPQLQFYVAQDGDAADSLREQLVIEDTVPLLVAVDVWRGAVSVLEDEAEEDDAEDAGAINAASVVDFMEAFLAGELPSAPIGVCLPPPPRPHHALLQQQQPPLEA